MVNRAKAPCQFPIPDSPFTISSRSHASIFLLVARGLAPTRERAQAMILAGRVEVAGRRADKAGASVTEDAEIRVAGPAHPYVSRGGIKLAAALDHFGIDPAGRVCIDVGASTGGFTDCLLQRGAARVYAIDVGRGQIDAKLRGDSRVVLREKVNARYLDAAHVPEPATLATLDLRSSRCASCFPPSAASSLPARRSSSWSSRSSRPAAARFRAGGSCARKRLGCASSRRSSRSGQRSAWRTSDRFHPRSSALAGIASFSSFFG